MIRSRAVTSSRSTALLASMVCTLAAGPFAPLAHLAPLSMRAPLAARFVRPCVLEDAAVPRQESVDAQMRFAAAARRAIRGTEGPARDAARAAAVRAYRAVREHYPDSAGECAEAAFRAGELLRAADDSAGAAAEFAIARTRGEGTAFRARAGLELGHLSRRAQKLTEALAAYDGVASDPAAPQPQRDDAWLWLGRVYSELGRAEESVRAWERVATGAQDPLDRVRAFDYLALARVAGGDLDGASSVVTRCREALAEVAQEETQTGERVRNALHNMRASDEIERARARRAPPPATG